MCNSNRDIDITAVVVVYNEDEYLDRCLQSIQHVGNLWVIDLGSNDKSVEIAHQYADKVTDYRKVSHLEVVLYEVQDIINTRWLLSIDPDEVIPSTTISHALSAASNEKNAIIKVNRQYYFRGNKLVTTRWGGLNAKPILFNLERVRMSKKVHEKVKSYDGKVSVLDQVEPIKHYWLNSYNQFIDKHRRYIPAEGKRRFKNNENYYTGKEYLEAVYETLKSLIYHKGLIGGVDGVTLSMLYGWYVYKCVRELKKVKDNVQ